MTPKIITTEPEKLRTGMFLNEPAEIYHSAKGYISSSPLPSLDESPAHFLESWQNGVEPTPPMDNGNFIHALCLEQDIERFVARPMKDGRLVASNTKEYKEFAAANEGKTPIHPDLYENAYEVLNAICMNKNFVKSQNECQAEVSFYGVDSETGLYLKGRTDLIPKVICDAINSGDYKEIEALKMQGSGLYIHDLKSTANIANFKKQVFTMGYDIRLIHYWETIRSVAKLLHNYDLGPVHDLKFTAIETSKPFGSKNFKLKPHEINTAYSKWRSAINTISACMADGNFPSYSDDWELLERPAFLVEDVEPNFVGAF